jgi:hypothetical protein
LTEIKAPIAILLTDIALAVVMARSLFGREEVDKMIADKQEFDDRLTSGTCLMCGQAPAVLAYDGFCHKCEAEEVELSAEIERILKVEREMGKPIKKGPAN